VKSQTSKGMAELQRLLGTRQAPLRVHAAALGAVPRPLAVESMGDRAGDARGRNR
jgi:hypothetical protein